MTVSSTPSEISYLGDNASTLFPIPFQFGTSADLKVTLTNSSGVITDLTTGFVVSGGGGSTGSLTLSVALASGYTMTILDDPERSQDTDYVSNDAFPASSHETALDKQTRLSKRLWQLIQRCVRTADGDAIDDLTLPGASARAGKYIYFNASTGALEVAASIGVTTLTQAIITNFLNPPFPDVTINGLRIGLGLNGATTNVSVGTSSLISNTSGSQNTAVGKSAMETNTTGTDNVAIGFSSLKLNTIGTKNVSVGSFNMGANTTGSFNTAVGQNCLDANTTGSENVAIGQGALFHNITGNTNVAVGEHALLTTTAADNNVAVGAYALEDCTGPNNVAVGRDAGLNISTGHENTVVGFQALSNATTAIDCVAVGHGAANANTADGIVAIGKGALTANTSGSGNVAVGRNALQTNTVGTENTAVGDRALLASTGVNSTAVGKNALSSLVGSGNCTAVGWHALTAATGTANTALGYDAGAAIVGGDSNTMIGFSTTTTATSQNSSSLGNAATCTGSNQITLGNAAIAALRCQQTTITALSDARFKKQIRDLTAGLDVINAVKMRTFKWKRRKSGPVDTRLQVGVIAQELKRMQKQLGVEWLGLVDETDPDRLEATPGKLLYPLIKAVQELSEQVSALRAAA